MKNNKLAIFLLLPVMLIQILIPCSFVFEKEKILSSGAEYKFEIEYILAQSDNELELKYSLPLYDDKINMRYAVFEEAQNGRYKITALRRSKPDTPLYLKSASSLEFVCPISVYALKDGGAKKIAEALMKRKYEYDPYSTAKIFNGKAVITGVFLGDGMPIEDIQD